MTVLTHAFISVPCKYSIKSINKYETHKSRGNVREDSQELGC